LIYGKISVVAGTKEDILLLLVDHGTGEMRAYLGIGHQISTILAHQNAGIFFRRIREKL